MSKQTDALKEFALKTEVIDAATAQQMKKGAKPFITPDPKVIPFPKDPTEETKLEFPTIVSAEDFLGERIPEPPQIIHGLLHRGCKMVLGGGSKSFKTWNLINLGLSVAAGEEWWGFKSTASDVLYINLELDKFVCQSRLNSILEARPELEKKRFHVLNLRGHAKAFKALKDDLLKQCGKDRFALIIIDPIYKVYGDLNENDATDMGTLLNGIDAFALQTGAAIVFGAHFSKGNQAKKDSMDRMSGSGVFARDPDAILTMTRHEKDDVFVIDSTLRNFKPVAPFCVRWYAPLMTKDESANPADLKQVNKKGPKFTEQQLLDVLGAQRLTNTEWQTRCINAHGMSGRTFSDILKNLKNKKRVSHDYATKMYWNPVEGEGTAELQSL